MGMRATLDRLISIGGLLLAVVLLVAGGLLLFAYLFVGNQIHDQLAAQKITMPDQTALAKLPAEDKAALEPYAGQLMTTGKQAQAYADHYIAVHLDAVAGGFTYSEISDQYLLSCINTAAATSGADCQQLGTQRATLFQGETLRGLLLTSYAFATMGTVAGIAAIGAFVAAIFFLVLALLGFRHARKAQEGQAAAVASAADDGGT
jgi:hypothetical protein